MRYLLLISERSRDEPGSRELAATMAAYDAFTNECRAAGAFVAASPLEAPASAKTVRVRDGETLISDGPFAETREQIGGYYLLECATLEEATALAARCPGARTASVEVRALKDLPGEHLGGGAAAAVAAP